MRGVAVERELRHDQRRTADIEKGTVHFSGLILEDPQLHALGGEVADVFQRIGPGDAEQNDQPGTDLPRGRSADRHLARGDPLQERPHRISRVNSLRVASSRRNEPIIELVLITECCFSTPRICMQRWRASMTTPTPWASRISISAPEIWRVSRSWIWSRPGEHVDDPRNLADAEDLLLRNIADMALSEEGEHVMFAETEKFDVPHDDHIVRLRFEEGAVDHRFQRLPVAAGQEVETLFDPCGGVDQSFPVGILPHLGENLSNLLLNFHFGSDSLKEFSGRGDPGVGQKLVSGQGGVDSVSQNRGGISRRGRPVGNHFLEGG